jgi:hypothetical protein
MAALLFLFTMVVPGDAAVLPLPAQFGLHHLASCSSFFFILGGAPAYLGTSAFVFSLLIIVFVFTSGAYHARLYLNATGNDAPPIGRPRHVKHRLSRAEWAARPFIPGVTKLCSVVNPLGERCNGPHIHDNCPFLPAAMAEKAARTAMLNDVRPVCPGSTAATPTGAVRWYAVAAVGRETGIFSSCAEVEPLVSGFSGARHKSFHLRHRAETWLAEARRQLAHVRLSNAAISSAAATEAASAGPVQWYAVAVGRETGIFSSWAEVQPLVTGFPGAKHKRFRHQYPAMMWLEQQAII